MHPGRYLLAMATLLFGATAVPAHAATIQITTTDLVFAPAEVSAKVGDTIVWVNRDPVRHTATARDKSFNVDLPPKASGKAVVRRAGSIAVYCVFHPAMTSKLAVARYSAD